MYRKKLYLKVNYRTVNSNSTDILQSNFLDFIRFQLTRFPSVQSSSIEHKNLFSKANEV